MTRKFMGFIKKAEDYTVDIDEVLQELNVHKRRIYDITNVLEGNFVFI